MTEVATRTSKNAVLGGVEAQASAAFDVRSPKGLTDMLQAARQSLKDEAYAAFRDTVLEYAQGGGTDQELRKRIEEVSKPFVVRNIKVVQETPRTAAPKVTGGDMPKNFVGMARPLPTFHIGATPKTERKPEQKIETKPVAFVPPNLPVGDMPNMGEVRREPVTPVSVPVPEVKVEKSAPVSRPQVRSIQTVDEYKARILEIKRTVNAQVGNPIVLMDSGDGIGREYMTALLGAMKAVSGTAPGTLQSSMERLEKAFVAVSNLGDTIQKAEESEVGDVTKEKIPPVPTTDVSKAETKDPEPDIQPLRATSAPIMPIRETVQIREEKPEIKVPVAHAIPEREEPERSPLPPKMQESKPAPEKRTVEVRTPLRASSAPIPSITEMPRIERHVPEKVGDTSLAVKDGSKHNAKGVGRSGYDVTIPGDVDTPVPAIVKDDLHAPEIEAGLDQLLREWSIFGGAGLFGTGKGGREHPLFKKIAPLPMEMVVSGSYEGATKEAILSVRDYANGWRHEQGVAYAPSESFENYLRRVIKRILKRQS